MPHAVTYGGAAPESSRGRRRWHWQRKSCLEAMHLESPCRLRAARPLNTCLVQAAIVCSRLEAS